MYDWFSMGNDKYGTDFRGGTEIVIALQRDDGSSGAVREVIENAGIKDATVQSFELGSKEYSIRVRDSVNVKDSIVDALKKAFGDSVTVLKDEVVGPTIGEELREKAIFAIVLALIVMLMYITVRFEFAFAVGAVVALFHDVIIATGLYLILGYPLNGATLAAALTIVGYSVNDTIVIYDRVREEIFARDHFDLRELMNECLNAMLSRTIITSLLTFFSVLALLVLGGGALEDLSVFLTIGLISGVYSTIYIASPVALKIEQWREARRVARTA